MIGGCITANMKPLRITVSTIAFEAKGNGSIPLGAVPHNKV